MAGKQNPLLRAPRHGRNPRHAQRHPVPLPTDANGKVADEIRRSGRSTKGQHTKNKDELDAEAAAAAVKPKPKSKPEKKPPPKAEAARSQSVQSGEPPEEAGEDEDIYRCVCGDQREIRGREMICCDKCQAWQHNKCLNLPGSEFWEGKTYYCEQCRPEDHAELLAAMARGERPWNRKKGSKGAKPKFRPSDMASEATATPEKKEDASPHPAPAPTPTPTPAAAPPQETLAEASNGHAETKPPKKSTPKSQPQSPLGEKRPHEAVAEKDTTTAKRRKSSAQHQEKSAGPVSIATDTASLPVKRKLFIDKLIGILSDVVKDASKSRNYRIPDGATPTSIATRLCLQIDHAAVAYHGEPESNSGPYAQHFRSLIVNTKKNPVLVDRLLDGTLTPEELASMSPEEMASEDKQKEIAAMREKVEKHSILTEESGPRIRKTHKGEEYVGEDNMDAPQEFRQPERQVRDSIDEGTPAVPPSPRTDGHQIVELPEEVAKGSSMSIDTSTPQTDSVRRPSTTFNIDSIFKKVQSPSTSQGPFIHRRQSSIRPQQPTPQEDNVDDADVDRLLKDEDNDVEMTGYAADPTIVWRGSVEMQAIGAFDAVARFVAGGDFGQVYPWHELLVPHLPIGGRVESQRGNEYIRGLPEAGHDVAVLSISPVTSEGKVVYDQIYSYFQPRERWGVVPTEILKHHSMRDLYVIPVEPGGSELPGFINMLEYCTIETPRQTPMLLLALVAKLPDTLPQHPPTQHFERYATGEIAAGQTSQPAPPINGPGNTNGPSPSPINPHGPQYSPVQSAFPQDAPAYPPHFTPPPNGHQVLSHSHNSSPQPNPPNALPQSQVPQAHMQVHAQAQGPPPTPTPTHHLNPKAVEIFGQYIDAPVVVKLLSESQVWTEEQMLNLKHIIDTNPAARTDMQVFLEHLQERHGHGEPGRQSG
ncbi:hypothetical protein K491DRAFT_679356 [Lophiostoma macrostomum CBS 122681]|uniref:Transcription factor BYE1 n=1 Tax=Lophiostoma macrostomum CBS 122681 TaxID=1314788 RepID=A0A6A6T4F9_9PLEO|nr:hypothetical protein K491DRAFT_679356 [Lophiostoma macrostomum CBS 122681]